jgi:hypothetical protein
MINPHFDNGPLQTLLEFTPMTKRKRTLLTLDLSCLVDTVGQGLALSDLMCFRSNQKTSRKIEQRTRDVRYLIDLLTVLDKLGAMPSFYMAYFGELQRVFRMTKPASTAAEQLDCLHLVRRFFFDKRMENALISLCDESTVVDQGVIKSYFF